MLMYCKMFQYQNNTHIHTEVVLQSNVMLVKQYCAMHGLTHTVHNEGSAIADQGARQVFGSSCCCINE